MLAKLFQRSLATCAVLFVPVALLAADAPDSSPAPAAADEYAATPDDVSTAGLKLGPSWSHFGCIQLGATCYDVFADNKGRLWVCEECFTTQNPNPGKCRKLTSQEIANAAWCA